MKKNGLFRRIWRSRVYSLAVYALTCAALLVCLCNGVQAVVSGHDPEKNLHPAAKGDPCIFVSDRDYSSCIGNPRVGLNRLYLPYPELDMVQVFDLTGEYLYTVNFVDGVQNGSSYCFVQGDAMYYMARKHACTYVFRQDVLAESLNAEEARELNRQLWAQAETFRPHTDADGNRYALRGADVLRITPSGAVEIFIDRNDWLAFNQCGTLYFWCGALLALLIPACVLTKPVLSRLAHKGPIIDPREKKLN